MDEPVSKTIICSVFFLDIVEYSKKSVAGQISLKERFNAFLSESILDVPVIDRIILDTGDGAAISFLGDIEDALRSALSMRRSLSSEVGQLDPPLLVRMGVNLGPVRLVKDINGQPNIVGDGINVAQRVMGFAEPGQILVSRSYFDAASRLSQSYNGMFLYLGSRTDKHVREHEIYEIGYPSDTGEYLRHGSSSNGRFRFVTSIYAGYKDAKKNLFNILKQGSVVQKITYGALLLLPLVLSVLLVAKHYSKPSVVLDNVAQSAPVPVLLSPVIASAIVNAEVPNDSQQDNSKASANKEKKSTPSASATEKLAPTQGLVTLSIKPWGEVYLDGKMVGVSPPLNKLKVAVGDHVVEIKNTKFPVYKHVVKIKAGEKIKIIHKFAN